MNNLYRIKNFPISFFSIVMGLAGFAISLEKAADIFGFSKTIPLFFTYSSLAIFLVLLLFYFLKTLFSFDAVKNEFNHPIKINFFPTFSISLLLLSVAFISANAELSKFFWYAGTFFHFALTLRIIGVWMHQNKFKITHMNPSWFIPAVGNMLVPVAGTVYFAKELSWFFLSFGLFFWIILLVIFFYRIFFHEPLPEKLSPTLFILIAPPAVGFISYFKLTGEINDFSKILYYFAVFITLLLLSQFRVFSAIRKFYLSWWAYSFPLSAISIASALMYYETKINFYKYFHLALLFLLAVLIFWLIAKTILSVTEKEICVED
jgi:tellurite resistance protein